jgi:pimeloyl-ACP methyl ester carboxylesterase
MQRNRGNEQKGKANMEGLNKISGCDNSDRLVDVVFVHGLDGDAQTTWHPKNQPEKFWPKWLGDDLPMVGVWSFGYAVHSSAWKGSTMPLADRATNTLDQLELDGIGVRPVIFICHSLGGLLVKQLLRHAYDYGNPDYKRIADQTKAIVFLSTPHSGADMATWMQHIGSLLRTTVSMEELEPHHPRLRELNIWYRNLPQASAIETLVYCETKKVAGILVVNETTADPGMRGVVPIPVDEDHVSICKPASRESQIYRRVKRLIEDSVVDPK